MEALPIGRTTWLAGYGATTPRLADAGYVSCWLDVRGTGSSGGIATDEYSAAERDDLVAVIDWLATSDWSSGNGRHVRDQLRRVHLVAGRARTARRRSRRSCRSSPSDDRYADDVHHFGGALKQLDVVDYPTYMVAMNALPPVPRIWGEDWRDEWQRRARAAEPWVLTWLAHQRRDEYWRYGSVREDIGFDPRGHDDRRRLGRRVHEHRAALVPADAGAASGC